MEHKFRIWQDCKMLMPEDVTENTFRYLLNRDGVVFGIDLKDMSCGRCSRKTQKGFWLF